MKGKIALATLAMIPMTANNAYASNIGTVTASSLNVRSGPSTSYTVVTTVKKNDKVNILQSSNGWYKIETSSGKQGWVSSSYISASNSNTNNSINNNVNNILPENNMPNPQAEKLAIVSDPSLASITGTAPIAGQPNVAKLNNKGKANVKYIIIGTICILLAIAVVVVAYILIQKKTTGV